MVFVQQFVNAPNFVTVHDDFFAILGFHYVAGLHVGCATILVFHPHLAVFEDINRRPVFEFDGLLNLGCINGIGGNTQRTQG